jgi:membrane-bound lytic murein transglycosylase B
MPATYSAIRIDLDAAGWIDCYRSEGDAIVAVNEELQNA